MTDSFIIETAELSKSYKGVEALRGLSLKVPAGSIYGFLGRNGAGKTTTVKVLLGMVRPDSGHARVFGLAADSAEASVDIRRRTGFVGEDKELYGYMTVEEIIRFTASFYPRWDGNLERRYLRELELAPDLKVKTLSRGTRTRLALLLALCRGADLLMLDEPTSGLDPSMIERVLQMLVAQVAAAETTVFFSSHQIAEVEQIADGVAIIDRGCAVMTGTLEEIRENYRRVEMVFDGDAPEPVFRAPGVERVRRDGRVLTVLSSAGTERILYEARSLNPVSVNVAPVTLREIFLETVAAREV